MKLTVRSNVRGKKKWSSVSKTGKRRVSMRCSAKIWGRRSRSKLEVRRRLHSCRAWRTCCLRSMCTKMHMAVTRSPTGRTIRIRGVSDRRPRSMRKFSRRQSSCNLIISKQNEVTRSEESSRSEDGIKVLELGKKSVVSLVQSHHLWTRRSQWRHHRSWVSTCLPSQEWQKKPIRSS